MGACPVCQAVQLIATATELRNFPLQRPNSLNCSRKGAIVAVAAEWQRIGKRHAGRH